MKPFPSDSIKVLIAIVSSGQILSRLREVGICLCELIGYFLAASVATLSGHRVAVEAGSDEEALLLDLTHALPTAAEHLLRHKAYHAEFGDAQPNVAIDPLTIITLIQLLSPMVMQLLQWIRDRRHPAPAPNA